MGLDAFVPCNCLSEGKTTEPPVDKTWIMCDEDGYYNLNPEYSDDADLNDKIYDWSEHCCEHPGMHLWKSICNWYGLRAFQQALINLDGECFPILTTQLPNVNGGSMSVENARKALEELDVFEQNIHKVRNVYLINEENNQTVYEYIDEYKGKVMYSKPYSLGFNINGLYIIESESNRIVFQGKHVTQQIYVHPEWIRRLAKVLHIKMKPVRKVSWINRETKECFNTSWGLSVYGADYPKGFTVEERAINVDDYQDIIISFRKIFEASIQMNRPVFWC